MVDQKATGLARSRMIPKARADWLLLPKPEAERQRIGGGHGLGNHQTPNPSCI
jgi:hypothetical protein